jgi:glycosyl transferase family 87
LKSSAKVGALWLLGAVIAAVLFAQTWSRAHRIGGIDLTSYLEASRVLVHGGNPYLPSASYPYIYPLFFAFALIPFSFVPADLALLLWYVMLLGALLWTTRAVLRLAYPGLGTRALTPFVAMLFAVSYPVIQSNLRNGQANLVVLALCILALDANRDGSEARGAFAWAVAIAIKIVPAVLVPFFVRRSRWRVVVVAFVTVAALSLLPVVTMGTAALSLTRSYLASFVSGSFSASHGADPLDFSAGGILVSVASGVPTFWLRAIGALAPIAVAVVADWRTRANATADMLAFARYLAVIPLSSPKSEVHHLAFALPAAAVTAASLWYGFAPRRGAVTWLLAGSMLSYLVATAVRAVADAGYFLSLCALVWATIVLMRQEDRSERESNPDAERPRRLDG